MILPNWINSLIRDNYLNKEEIQQLIVEIKILKLEIAFDWLMSGFEVINKQLVYRFKPMRFSIFTIKKSRLTNHFIESFWKELVIPRSLFEMKYMRAIIIDGIGLTNLPPFRPGKNLKFIYIDEPNLKTFDNCIIPESVTWLYLRLNLANHKIDFSRFPDLKFLKYDNSNTVIDKSIEKSCLQYAELLAKPSNVHLENIHSLEYAKITEVDGNDKAEINMMNRVSDILVLQPYEYNTKVTEKFDMTLDGLINTLSTKKERFEKAFPYY
ncbi:MAG: hypothetical protein INQ03_03675 [Candidatus Heimdallarchaeota archaeon]|nr:hypothetical protein [Candidatus Heimdallarchaeota archaeon]